MDTAGKIKNPDIFGEFINRVMCSPSDYMIISEEIKISYEEAYKYVNFISEKIIEATNGERSRIILRLTHSHKIILSILAVLKTGNSYVPTRRDLSAEELMEIACDCNTTVIILDEDEPIDMHRIILSANIDAGMIVPTKDHKVYSTNDEIYVLYTSGSTGKRKGCSITYGNLLYIIENMRVIGQGEIGDVYCFSTPYTFDVSTIEIYSFLYGAKIFVCDTGMYEHFKRFPKLVNEFSITHLAVSPSSLKNMIRSYDNAQWSLMNHSLKCVMVAGEAFKKEIFEEWDKERWSFRLINLYGPTEATVYATMFELQHGDDYTNGIPIGKCLNNCEYTIDKKDGAKIGELILLGAGIANGYINNRQESEHRFLTIDNKKAYKTGDLVSEHNGLVFYHGRNDDQIQINGIRVELGEIETYITAIKEINEAVVLHYKGVLIAIVLLNRGETMDDERLKTMLQQQMPRYMIPNIISFVSEMPLNTSNKIDKKKLLNDFLTQKNTSALDVRDDGVDDVQNKTLKIMRSCLEDKPFLLREKDDFFENGGDSLSAVLLTTELERCFDLKINVDMIYLLRTAEKIAQHIHNNSLGGIKRNPKNIENRCKGVELFSKLIQLNTCIKEYIYETDTMPTSHYDAIDIQNAYYKRNTKLVVSFVFDLENSYSYDQIKRSLVDLLRSNPVLRSKLIMQPNKLIFEEYDIPSKISFPEIYLESEIETVIDYIEKNTANEIYYARYLNGFLSLFVIVQMPDKTKVIGFLDHTIADAHCVSIIKRDIGASLAGKPIGIPKKFEEYCKCIKENNSELEKVSTNWFIGQLRSTVINDRKRAIEEFTIGPTSLVVPRPKESSSSEISVYIAYVIGGLLLKRLSNDSIALKTIIDLRESPESYFYSSIGDYHHSIPLYYKRGMPYEEFRENSRNIITMYTHHYFSPKDAIRFDLMAEKSARLELAEVMHNCSITTINYIGECEEKDLSQFRTEVVAAHDGVLRNHFASNINITAVSCGETLHIFMNRGLTTSSERFNGKTIWD